MQTLLIFSPVLVAIVSMVWNTGWTTLLFVVSIPISLKAYLSSKDERLNNLPAGLSFFVALGAAVPLYHNLRSAGPLNADAALVFFVSALNFMNMTKENKGNENKNS